TNAYEPPQQIDNANGVFVAPGESFTYDTLFNDEAFTVYNAATGGKLFKLRLNPTAGAVYSLSQSSSKAEISDASGAYTVTLGTSFFSAAPVRDCPFGMTASVSRAEVTCTLTTSSFILGISD